MKQKYILLIIIGVTLLSLSAAAQSHWTLAAGQNNTFLYGEQQSYLGGFRMGFDYRYDFRKGKGVGIETGLYYRYAGRKYKDDIFGVYNVWDGEWEINGTQIVSQEFLHCAIHQNSLILPLHLTFTHLFYEDWSITAFAGMALQYDTRSYVGKYKRALTYYGESRLTGRLHPINNIIDFPIDFGLGFAYKHLQMKLGASLAPTSYVGHVRFDGSVPTQEEAENNPDRYFWPAELYLTAGYRF